VIQAERKYRFSLGRLVGFQLLSQGGYAINLRLQRNILCHSIRMLLLQLLWVQDASIQA
jgi:hypothetical protein